jgi:hypothetical protein
MPQKDTDELEEFQDPGKFFYMMRGEDYRLGDEVSIDLYNHSDVFKVVGIREMELELKGDWSGGTHNVSQSGWYPVKKCKLVLPDYDWAIIKGEEI